MRPPPVNVLAVPLVSDSKIFAVSLLKVSPVVVSVVQTVPVPLSVHSPEPIVIVRVLLLLEANVVQVKL